VVQSEERTKEKRVEHLGGLLRSDEPVCSRDYVLGVYQWYRVLSPSAYVEVDSCTYDAEQRVAYLNIRQFFQPFFSPFSPSPSQLLVRLHFSQSPSDGKYYIVSQDVFLEPEGIINMFLPPLSPFVTFLKHVATRICSLNAALFRFFGIWSLSNDSPGLLDSFLFRPFFALYHLFVSIFASLFSSVSKRRD